MSKGGGSSGQQRPTQQTVTQTNLPAYLEPSMKRLISRAEGLTEPDTPFERYEGVRIAPLREEQEESFDIIGEAVAAPTTASEAASAYYSGILGAPGGEPRGYRADTSAYDVGAYDPSSYQDYLNPYTESVIDVNRRAGERQFRRQQKANEAGRIARGTRGGSRAAIERAVNQDMFERRMADQANQLRMSGVTAAQQQAQAQFNREQTAKIQAAQAASGERQLESAYGLKAAQAAMASDPLALKAELERARAIGSVGEARRGLDQASADLAYTDFISERDKPRADLNYLAAILRGVPSTAVSDVMTYKAPPSLGGQLAGAGLSAAGLYKLLS